MEVDHCGSWVTKRNLNLENFLRKLGKEFGFPRYYDTCALESKGALSLRHVIVTDSTLLFTENVPKTVLLFIPLRNVKNIEVVADRKALLKGGKSQPCICQHVQLHCTTPSKNADANQTSHQDKQNDTNGRKSITPINMATLLSSTLPDSDSSFTDYSRQSSRLDGSFLPPGLLEAYESPVVPALPPLLLIRSRATAGSTSSSSSSTHLGARVGRTRENGSGYHRPRRNWSKTGSTSELDLSSTATIGRREFMEEQKLDDENQPETKRIRRPRSLDLNQVTRLKEKMLRLILRESPRDKSTVQNISINSLESQEFFVDFYLYRPNSVMLNELFLFWNRQRLKTLLREDLRDDVTGKLRGLRAAEKAFIKLSQIFSNSKDNPTEFQDDILPKLTTAHTVLVKYDQMPRILWKDWTMITHFLTLLKSCLTSKNIKAEDEDTFVDRLFSIAILMDIFRLLIEATGPSWFLNQNTDHNNNSLRNSTEIPFSEDEKWSEAFSLSPAKERSQTTIASLHELTSTLVGFIFRSSIVCSTDTKAIKAVSLVHNSSVALLHEILSVVHFSPKDKKRAQFMSFLGEWSMDAFLNLSMKQILNLLWDNGETLGASQIVMLYRLVHTAQTLSTYHASMQFLRHNFSEEFRYFVHEDSVNKKIPDRYPLKPMLLSLCEQLRQEIIDK